MVMVAILRIGGGVYQNWFMFIAHDLVLDTLQILEEESVVAWRRILWILLWWTHYCGSYLLQLRMQLVDFGARFHFECEMM